MSCELCQDTGYVVTERNGVSGAARCPHYSLVDPATSEDYAATVRRLSTLLNFFPTPDEDRALIGIEIEKRLKTKAQLKKLESTACLLGKWEGLANLLKAYEGNL